MTPNLRWVYSKAGPLLRIHYPDTPYILITPRDAHILASELPIFLARNPPVNDGNGKREN